jgi:predicted subunit of tRNA(5-methylaminomethyl-2-thiouridylate) methyltransferase
LAAQVKPTTTAEAKLRYERIEGRVAVEQDAAIEDAAHRDDRVNSLACKRITSIDRAESVRPCS